MLLRIKTVAIGNYTGTQTMKEAQKNKVFEVQILLDKFLFLSFQIDLGGRITTANRPFIQLLSAFIGLHDTLCLIGLHLLWQ